MNSGEFQKHAEEIERLVQRVSSIADDDARTAALELLRSLMNFHGGVVSRIVELLSDSDGTGRTALKKLGSDPLICGALVLYGVHPVPLNERVTCALHKVAAQLRKHSASAEIIEIADTVVRVKVHSSGHGCGSSPATVKELVEQAILEAAPEVVEVVTEGLLPSASGFVPVNMIQSASQEEKYEKSTA